MHRIMLACSNGATRLFRQNVGLAWIGAATKVTRTQMILVNPGDVVIRNARPFRAGVEGMSDLVGWTSVEGHAIYTAIECKGDGGRIRPAQQVFIDQVLAAGGIAGIVRSEDEALRLVNRSS